MNGCCIPKPVPKPDEKNEIGGAGWATTRTKYDLVSQPLHRARIDRERRDEAGSDGHNDTRNNHKRCVVSQHCDQRTGDKVAYDLREDQRETVRP